MDNIKEKKLSKSILDQFLKEFGSNDQKQTVFKVSSDNPIYINDNAYEKFDGVMFIENSGVEVVPYKGAERNVGWIFNADVSLITIDNQTVEDRLLIEINDARSGQSFFLVFNPKESVEVV